MRIAVNTRLLLKDKLEGIGWYTNETLSRIVKSHPEHEFYFLFDISHKILYNIIINNSRRKGDYMSYQIQDSITEYIDEQVENRIHDVVPKHRKIPTQSL